MIGLGENHVDEELSVRDPIWEKYNHIIDAIYQGVTPFEVPAREFALKHNLPIEPIDLALKYGYKNLYKSLISMVKRGYIHSEKNARELAIEHGFPTKDLDEALEIGKALRSTG